MESFPGDKIDPSDDEPGEEFEPEDEAVEPEDGGPVSVEHDALDAKFTQVEQRASTTGLPTARRDSPNSQSQVLSVNFSEADDRLDTRVVIRTADEADKLLSLPFEQFRVVPNYSVQPSTA